MVTCWDRAEFLALVGDVDCIFVTLPCNVLGQVWYLIVPFPDLCRLSYLDIKDNKRKRALLLHYSGEQANDIFDTLPDTGNDYATAWDKLTTVLRQRNALNLKFINSDRRRKRQMSLLTLSTPDFEN